MPDRVGRFASVGIQPGWEVTFAVLTQLWALAARALPETEEDGQGLAEYALILALIAIVAIVALLFLGNQISDKLSVIGNAL
jgi:pilus assembly protein Flp/PilA